MSIFDKDLVKKPFPLSDSWCVEPYMRSYEFEYGIRFCNFVRDYIKDIPGDVIVSDTKHYPENYKVPSNKLEKFKRMLVKNIRRIHQIPTSKHIYIGIPYFGPFVYNNEHYINIEVRIYEKSIKHPERSWEIQLARKDD